MPKSYLSRGTSGQNVLRRLAQPLIAVSNGRVEVARGVVFAGSASQIILVQNCYQSVAK